jgi:hypothetical protein
MDNEEEIRKYFDFNDADLFANRNGYLSPRQQARDKQEQKGAHKVLLIFGFIIVAADLFPFLVLLIEKTPWQHWLLWLIIWLPIWTFLAILVFRLSGGTSTPDILKTIEGQVDIIKEENEDNHANKFYDYYWSIGGVKFDVADSEKVDILQQGDIYRVYYLDLAKEIMSLEKLAKN